jgi:hypothetical protein
VGPVGGGGVGVHPHPHPAEEAVARRGEVLDLQEGVAVAVRVHIEHLPLAAGGDRQRALLGFDAPVRAGRLPGRQFVEVLAEQHRGAGLAVGERVLGGAVLGWCDADRDEHGGGGGQGQDSEPGDTA